MTDSPTPTASLSAAGTPLPKRWLAVVATIWAGQAVSMVTSYAAGYAAIWYVTETTGSALALAAMSICAYLPMGLIAPFGGAIADKHNRKLVMIAADLGVGLVSLALGVVILLGQVTLGLLVVLVVARSIGQALHSPAMMASMPLLVPEKHLLRINTLDQLLVSAASIGAPAFGILLYTTIGFHSVMFLDFFGALAAVAGLALAKIPTVRDEAAENQHVVANLRDGWRAVAENRGLLVLLGGITLVMIVFAPLGSIYPLMTYDYFGGDGYMAALAEAVFGAGMIVGSGVLMATGGGKKLARLIAIATLVVGASTVACGLMPPTAFPAFVALCGVMAVASAWYNGPMITLVQRNVPSEKMGRAMGLTTSLISFSSPIGIALGGALAEGIGIAPFFVVDGVICLVLGALIYLPKSVRALDRAPAAADGPDNAAGDAGEPAKGGPDQGE